MSKYLETAEALRKEVKSFIERYITDRMHCDSAEAFVQLGHIINLAVRCNPRQPQGTVRKNIVATAMKDYCRVTMTREEDPKTGRTFNKIHIQPKGVTQ